LSSSVREKYQYMVSVRFMHPLTPWTSAHSDDLSRLMRFMYPGSCWCQRVRMSISTWFMHPRTSRTSAPSYELSRF